MSFVTSLLDLPNNYAIYVFYQKGITGLSAYYVGSGSKLRKSVFYDYFDFAITGKKSYRKKNLRTNKVTEIRWWLITRDEYNNWDHRTAEMVIINEILKPKISGSNYLSDEARKYYKDKKFRSRVESRITGTPDGCWKITNWEHERDKFLGLKAAVINLINDPIADALGIYTHEEKKKISQHFWMVSEPKKTIEFANYLAYEHQYNEFLVEDLKAIKYIGLSLALGWIGHELHEIRYSQDLVSAYSVLVGTNYELTFDAEAIYYEMYHGEKKSRPKAYGFNLTTEPPAKEPMVPYSNMFDVWPEFKILQNAPTQAKKGLIYIALRSGRNANRFINALQLPRVESLKEGLGFLIKNGLVNVNPAPTEMLELLTYKELKEFALQKGLEIPRNKQKLCNLIVDEIDIVDIKTFIHEMVILENPIRLKIEKPQLFKKQIKCELDRFDFYRLWLWHKTYKPNQLIEDEKLQSGRPGDWYLDQEHSDATYLRKATISLRKITLEEQSVIEKYWDDEFDEILEIIIHQNTTKIPRDEATLQIARAMKIQGKLSAYRREMAGNGPASFYWRNVLSGYIENLLLSNTHYQLSSNRKICHGCGRTFIENSVRLEQALRVGKKINFCEPCYSFILGHEYYADNREAIKQSDDEMLSNLRKLADALEGIPTQTFMQSIDLSNYSSEKQIEIGSALLGMPSYRIYLQRFETWLASLKKADVLKDGYMQTSRGIQCLANDGHLCLSLGEKEIDDWLYSRNIPHEKETRYPYDPELNPNELQRCDWKIGEIYVEYAGMMSDYEYSMRMKDKQLLSKNHNLRLVVLYPDDLGRLEEKLGFLLESDATNVSSVTNSK